VQGSGTIFVPGIDEGAGSDEFLKGLNLPHRIPPGPRDGTIGGVVKGRTPAMVCRGVGVCPGRQQDLDDFDPVPGCGQVQCRVARINPMSKFNLVQTGAIHRARGKTWVRRQQTPDLGLIIIHDGVKEWFHPGQSQ
jgi:hypothetical protein